MKKYEREKAHLAWAHLKRKWKNGKESEKYEREKAHLALKENGKKVIKSSPGLGAPSQLHGLEVNSASVSLPAFSL